MLKKNKFSHLLDPPTTLLKPGINTSARRPIEIKIKKIEIF